VLPIRNQAVWLVPTDDFQREHYAKRDWVSGVVGQCDDSQAAFENWMKRDVQFARWIVTEAESLGCKVFVVNGQQTMTKTALEVAAHFGLEDIS